MKKFINDGDNVVEEMIEGFVAANSDLIERKKERVLVQKGAPFADKVGLVTGGGSGHQPALIGYLGEAMFDAIAVGDIFASPGVEACYDAIKAADSGKGVLVTIGNYSGDKMNFSMAIDKLREEGHDVELLIVNDDVASSDDMDNRRGIAGEIVLWKVVGAMAENGASLEEMKKVGEDVIFKSRSAGVAHTPCIMPSTGEKSFEIGDNEMEIGVGHHGEPGIERVEMKSADETTDIIMDMILDDYDFKEGDDVLVIINGLGSTSLLEMDIIFRRVKQILDKKNINIYENWIGNFFTSMEMGGFSITLTQLDKHSKEMINQDVNAVQFPLP
ncbi:MAG: dihydroxyacetone kinase subunit DhaK [Halanaerobium sp.]